ncbi:ROK family protein [Candidatus Auribacterota bacterium]
MKYGIGIDLGGTNLKIALVSQKGKIIGQNKFSTVRYRGQDQMIKKIVNVADDLIKKADIDKGHVAGIGVGVPGIVDSKHGIIYNLTNISGWKNVHLKEKLEKWLKLPAYVDNDVNMMALGELYFGAAQGGNNVVCITLGTGVGGGIIVDGKLYRGSSLSAGEVGHITIDEKGPECNCGNNGCLEVYVGNSRIVATAVAGLEAGCESIINKLVDNDLTKVTCKIIDEAALKGDEFSIGIWETVGVHLGIVLAGMINFFNPDMIVIGGGVAKAGDLIFNSMKATITKRAIKVSSDKVKIRMAQLGYESGMIGAAVLPMIEEGVLHL